MKSTTPSPCDPSAAAFTVGVSISNDSVGLALAGIGGGVLALLVLGLLLYLAFRYAEHLLRPLGEAGAIVFLRLSAFILLCLGVQIVWDGVSELVRGLVASL